jgi:hypothetical protein
MVNILWNQKMQTDRTIPNNKPGTLTRANGRRTSRLIDTGFQGTEM